MEQCWQVRALQKSHPFVIKTPQIIYLIRKESRKRQHILTVTTSEFFFHFSPVGEERKEALKIYSSFFFSHVCVCMLYMQCMESMLESKAKHQSIGSDSHVLWLIKCKWAKLFSEKVVYTPKRQKCEPSL